MSKAMGQAVPLIGLCLAGALLFVGSAIGRTTSSSATSSAGAACGHFYCYAHELGVDKHAGMAVILGPGWTMIHQHDEYTYGEWHDYAKEDWLEEVDGSSLF
jgi:hypothetical protein